MPYVNGQHYRSAGQGYAAEKAKTAGPAKEDAKPVEGEHGSRGSVLHVKHHGGGKISIKHEDGQVTQHEGMDDAAGHMAQHFGLDGAESDHDSDDSSEYDGDGGEALKSILG
jgi:hypothetical protein